MTAIAGSRIVVTGAASGMGRLTALALARRGADLVLWDIAKESLDQVVEEVGRAAGRPAHGYLCDVGRREHVYEVAARVEQECPLPAKFDFRMTVG